MSGKLTVPQSIIDAINELDLDKIVAEASMLPIPTGPPLRHPYPYRSRLSIAGRVRKLRRKMKLSQREFCKLFSVNAVRVWAWENCKNYPLPVHLKRLEQLEAEWISPKENKSV